MRVRLKTVPASIVMATCFVWFSGCGWWSAQADNSVEEDLADVSDDTLPAVPAAKPTTNPQPLPELNLKPKDRIALLKTVEHTLRQHSPQGWIVSRSTLDLLLSITVTMSSPSDRPAREPDLRSGQKRMHVTFQRIHFSQELPGQPRVEYDSNSPPFPIPLAAQGYHGLKDNGFDFWLTADNQLAETIGFEQFINRCLKDVSPDKRQSARAAMAVASEAEGVAVFVDDTIGLLPANVFRDGDTWTRDRHVLQPVPLRTSTRYRLRQSKGEIAEIEIQGAIAPSESIATPNPPTGEIAVAVRGGQSRGTCFYDRRIGLPVESQTQQSLEMTVRLPDGSEFEQHKSTLTTIKQIAESEPAQPASRDGTPSLGPPPRISQAGAEGLGAAKNVSPTR